MIVLTNPIQSFLFIKISIPVTTSNLRGGLIRQSPVPAAFLLVHISCRQFITRVPFLLETAKLTFTAVYSMCHSISAEHAMGIEEMKSLTSVQ